MGKAPWYYNFWFLLALSALFGLISTLFFPEGKLPAFGVSMAFSGQVFSYMRSQYERKQRKIALIDVLKRFASDKIGMTKAQLKQRNDSSIIHCLASLEIIVTDIRNCCNRDQVEKFKKTKGLIAATKTTFDKSLVDPSIARPYSDAMAAISNLESFLSDL